MRTETAILDVFAAFHTADEETRLRMAEAAMEARNRPGTTVGEDDKLLSLTEVCRRLHRTPSWAIRIGLSEACGHRFGGGRPLFRLSECLAYLESSACKARRAELRRTGWGRRSKAAERGRVRGRNGRASK